MKNLFFLLLAASLLVTACKDKEPEPTAQVLRLKLQFDESQTRLDNIGNPSSLPAGHAAQNPTIRGFSAHFMELIPNNLTPYRGGEQVFMGAEVAANNPNSFGFTTAIDFDNATVVGPGETFLEIPLADLRPGTYKHLRVSVSYQNYDVRYNLRNIPVVGDLPNQSGTIASFVGYNSHINNLLVRNRSLAVNGARLQGFWAFETNLAPPYDSFNQVVSGQAPENATTVVNPFPNSPIPAGSCVVSGNLDKDLVITGTETEDIELTLSFSINQSFEWVDTNNNGEWDIDASGSTSTAEPVVDMGLRGLIGKVGQ